jgi:hypothetical protein
MLASVVAAPSQALPALPPRSVRVDAVRAMMGTPDPSLLPLARGIRRAAHRQFDAHVVPLLRTHWPELGELPFRHKLRIAACDLYAAGGFTGLLLSPPRTVVTRALVAGANVLPLPLAVATFLGERGLEVFGRFGPQRALRRIVLIAAFIAVVDHVFDHCMDEAPEVRGPTLEAVIDGRELPRRPELALVRGLAAAMAENGGGESLGAEEREAFDLAMIRVKEWIRSEVKAMCGVPDPRGMGHRLAGIEGTIDGLLCPIPGYASGATRAWMYHVSMYVQVMDDWFDIELDLASNRSTPAVTGEWTFADVEATWIRSVSDLDSLARAAGLDSARSLRLVRETYVLMMHEVMEAMAQRPDE